MLLNIVDGTGLPQRIIVEGQETVIDQSGLIVATGVAQVLAAANANRSGIILQNDGSHNMEINDLAAAASPTVTDNGSFVVTPGSYWPPAGYPVSTGAISVSGTTGDTYTCRTW
jgi:hypothetical protein